MTSVAVLLSTHLEQHRNGAERFPAHATLVEQGLDAIAAQPKANRQHAHLVMAAIARGGWRVQWKGLKAMKALGEASVPHVAELMGLVSRFEKAPTSHRNIMERYLVEVVSQAGATAAPHFGALLSLCFDDDMDQVEETDCADDDDFHDIDSLDESMALNIIDKCAKHAVSIVPELHMTLASPHWLRREMALKVLEKLGEHAAPQLPAVIKALEDDAHPRVRASAVSALYWIQGGPNNNKASSSERSKLTARLTALKATEKSTRVIDCAEMHLEFLAEDSDDSDDDDSDDSDDNDSDDSDVHGHITKKAKCANTLFES